MTRTLTTRISHQSLFPCVQVQKDTHVVDAENIRMSMFTFERDSTGVSGRMGYRGRGRGRGRGRRGGRGRGRG